MIRIFFYFLNSNAVCYLKVSVLICQNLCGEKQSNRYLLRCKSCKMAASLGLGSNFQPSLKWPMEIFKFPILKFVFKMQNCFSHKLQKIFPKDFFLDKNVFPDNFYFKEFFIAFRTITLYKRGMYVFA